MAPAVRARARGDAESLPDVVVIEDGDVRVELTTGAPGLRVLASDGWMGDFGE